MVTYSIVQICRIHMCALSFSCPLLHRNTLDMRNFILYSFTEFTVIFWTNSLLMDIQVIIVLCGRKQW